LCGRGRIRLRAARSAINKAAIAIALTLRATLLLTRSLPLRYTQGQVAGTDECVRLHTRLARRCDRVVHLNPRELFHTSLRNLLQCTCVTKKLLPSVRARRKIHFKAARIRAGQNLCLHDSFVWLKMKGTSLDL
jgi:hypothetical protein